MHHFLAGLDCCLASGAAVRAIMTRMTFMAFMVPMAFVAETLLAEDTADDPRSCEMRVESELFAADGDRPVAHSLTLFHEGVAWDFLELPSSRKGDMALGEIVLHDPARERVLVIDPVRHLKTQVDLIRLERLSVSLAKWARSSDDRLVRWAGGPDFASGFTQTADGIELVGPRVKYAVAYEEAPSKEAAGTYRRFADTAILLKALLHPGGIPPFPRLAVNRRLEDVGAIPAEVTLEIDSRLAPLDARTERLRCVHKQHPRLLAGDLDRIEQAKSHIATAEAVDLAAFAGRDEHEPARSEAPGS
ncbi:MAG: hypothetical protein K8S94_15230 [Planctomycetia bacterium]|nr:hypothetical protein [Planctomycetia bacterium]